MAVVTTTQVFNSSVSPARLFKAMVLDAQNLLPKLVPYIESIQVIEGDGGAGSITKTSFIEASPIKFLKHKIGVIDTSNYQNKSTLIEGDVLGDKLESIVTEVKFEASGTGCVYTTTSHFHAKAGVELTEEETNLGKEQPAAMFKIVEDYLVANPEVYA